MEEEKVEKEVKEITPEEQIMVFRNGHLKEFIGALIRLEQAKQASPDEVVGYREVAQHGGMVSRIDIKAKEMIKHEELGVKNNARFLIAIEKVSEQFKTNKELWKTIK